MSLITRQVTWGEGLMVETSKHGGLRQIVDHITGLMGDQGTRNTFGKLLSVTDPGTLKPRDLWRAWMLLAAMGQDPAEWGISDDVVPPLFRDRADELKSSLSSPLSDSNRRPPLYKTDALTTTGRRRQRTDRPRARTDQRGPGTRAA